MKEKNDFALVPRPPGALEKAEPGAKRVLSGMVVDTLVLAKKETVRKSCPLRIVVVYDEEGPRKSLEFMLRHWFPDVTLLLRQSSIEALEVLSQSDDPDLLITGTWFPVCRGKEFVERVTDRKATYPIVVASAFEPEETWVREYVRRGVNISFLPLPYTLESLRKAMEAAGFEFPRDTFERPTQTTEPLRIVLVDDDPLILEFMELAILKEFNAEVNSFEDPIEGWRELEQTDPDLLITGAMMPGLSGEEIVRRLIGRKVAYPIIVVSGSGPAAEHWVRSCAQEFSDITFLEKPFTMEHLCTTISRYF